MMGVKLSSILTVILIILHGLTSAAAALPEAVEAATSLRSNTTYYNPILPGFHPDPSCIFLKEWDNTFFCASSSFNAFPGIPLHASKDLRNWKLIGHALNRNEQLPRLAETNRSTSGIWAATLRYHKGTFYVITTLVDDDRPPKDASRWDNIIFKSKDPYTPSAWSIATHFSFEGYDPDLFWDVGADGKEKTYVTGAHAWHVDPGIWQAEADLEKGTVGELKLVWKGTGGTAPEGPHIYKKDGWYYLLAAEGGTGLEHMVTISRSKNINGPFEQNPANPVLTNTNTTSYFQTIGHSDLFQDHAGNWWAVALSTRGGPEYLHFPMVRETVLTPVTWKQGEWPVFSPIRGEMSGWDMGKEDRGIKGVGPFVDDADDIDFAKLTRLPEHFTHWRYPIPSSYTLSPPSHPGTLRLTPSVFNLTALTGNYAGPTGQTFVGRRQSHTLFTYIVDLEFSGTVAEEEVGVSAFLTQNHHIDLGVVVLPIADGTLQPHLRYRAISYIPVPEPIVVSFPVEWKGYDTGKLALEIRAINSSHYAFSAGPTGARSLRRTIATVSNEGVSWGFTGVLLGVYSTTNGGAGSAPAYISKWKYVPEGQFRD
ncbi:hypothetical protein D9611_013748 [Ephemerocybe angulata]|uniref:Beta-xylosidase C-terminal Concanavalin A-like domain-containing protein n=1 Tax=Ephemerocybe angulata TaxID=980116 RepID=A0A8H5BCF5_9AGAR|nr:hypothetical protein D9611_013748 [Tulosesus angulatus]